MSTAERITTPLFAGFLSLGLLSLGSAAPLRPEGPRLGTSLTQQEADASGLHVFPDGTGLPEGQGDLEAGARLYESRCAGCHGPKGSGGTAGELVGDSPLNGPHPDQTIGNYWPYATTLFDFIRRAMPLNAPGSLSSDEVYAVTGYLLALNGLVKKDDNPFNREALLKVRMPNRDGFISLWPEEKTPPR